MPNKHKQWEKTGKKPSIESKVIFEKVNQTSDCWKKCNLITSLVPKANEKTPRDRDITNLRAGCCCIDYSVLM